MGWFAGAARGVYASVGDSGCRGADVAFLRNFASNPAVRYGTTSAIIALVKKASPARRLYRCADGALLAVACENEAQWKALAKCLGRPELAYAGDWAVASTSAYKGRLGKVLEALFKEDTAEVWVRRLEAQGVPTRIAAKARRGGSRSHGAGS